MLIRYAVLVQDLARDVEESTELQDSSESQATSAI